ncbi:MAG: Alw26I/Eco31I/Esp3I family type II restriction endonuclease [Verrucomicrobia bacterium]|nr:Alw26I/Eco31I/Esp3I family type II restriction endonuclease [Verrucomicrobiota bacterium]
MPARKQYGSKGQTWHPDFVAYMEFIARHPSYAGMPDAYAAENKIQWEAPSNRGSGRFKETHGKRLNWWRRKARELGISVNADKWISKTAKKLHPTGKKPCKRCGRVLEIRYAYPRDLLLNRIRKLSYVESDFTLDRLEHIAALIGRLHGQYGRKILEDLPVVLRASGVNPPSTFNSLADCLAWIETQYIPAEPSVLSPGAMSNAPDRFDGFHSFNLCCRGVADTGRHKGNLSSYVTDRRVFEYWADGDWIAADRLMGAIRSTLGDELCLRGHSGPCDADHIGPISLGFTHHALFQMLCKSCNSAKNNRMSLSDVQHLVRAEAGGADVMSWHSKALWDLRKNSVSDDETALRLSKLLRDNRHSFMAILRRIERAGHYAFLLSLLNLDCADFDVEFEELEVVDHLTRFRVEKRKRRTTKYALEQKARRCRIALESLRTYFKKENRNAFVIALPETEAATVVAIAALKESPEEFRKLDKQVARVLKIRKQDAIDSGFRRLLRKLPSPWPEQFRVAQGSLREAMQAVARELSQRWDDERYVRAEVVSD